MRALKIKPVEKCMEFGQYLRKVHTHIKLPQSAPSRFLAAFSFSLDDYSEVYFMLKITFEFVELCQ